jgi:predicted Zn-dependent protease
VLGHEIVHAAARHGALAMQRGLLLQGAVAIAGVATSRSDYSELVIGAAGLGAQLIHLSNGRNAELEADAYGMRYMSAAGYDPQAAVSLQQTFVRLSGGNEGGRLATLFASHPPSMERVEQNRRTAASLPPGGTVGREAYQTATARLRREEPGFEAVDAGRRALADNDLTLARREAANARELLPDSADVDALQGDIELAANRPGPALGFFDSAVRRNNRFFRYQLGKAEAHRALDQLAEAKAAYEASIELLPTASAYYGLGRVAERQGDRAAALESYGRAAESSGAAGVAARTATVRLDIETNPERYLSLAAGLDATGQLLLEVGNPTVLPVSGIVLDIGYREGGQVRRIRRTLPDRLETGATVRIATGLGPFASAADYDVGIDTAQIAERQ